MQTCMNHTTNELCACCAGRSTVSLSNSPLSQKHLETLPVSRALLKKTPLALSLLFHIQTKTLSITRLGKYSDQRFLSVPFAAEISEKFKPFPQMGSSHRERLPLSESWIPSEKSTRQYNSIHCLSEGIYRIQALLNIWITKNFNPFLKLCVFLHPGIQVSNVYALFVKHNKIWMNYYYFMTINFYSFIVYFVQMSFPGTSFFELRK